MMERFIWFMTSQQSFMPVTRDHYKSINAIPCIVTKLVERHLLEAIFEARPMKLMQAFKHRIWPWWKVPSKHFPQTEELIFFHPVLNHLIFVNICWYLLIFVNICCSTSKIWSPLLPFLVLPQDSHAGPPTTQPIFLIFKRIHPLNISYI